MGLAKIHDEVAKNLDFGPFAVYLLSQWKLHSYLRLFHQIKQEKPTNCETKAVDVLANFLASKL